ncbi:unnamed protein product [Staurois parvus]|uniref:Uncharacterized protein n=1 Tax=Staurois parvus TaxID=386267 RepID=A0ABN9G8K1_9NEOB|nr:unnamed protein product [Staurois parvus]
MTSMICKDSTKSSRHGMNKLATYCNFDLFPFFKNNPLLEPRCWMESDAQLVSSEFLIGV